MEQCLFWLLAQTTIVWYTIIVRKYKFRQKGAAPHMKKRITAVGLSLCILFCLTACTKQTVINTSSAGVTEFTEPTHITETTGAPAQTTTTAAHTSASSKRTATTTKRAVAAKPQAGTSANGHKVSVENQTVVEEIRVPQGGVVQPPKETAPDMNQNVQVNTAHKALAATAYYQYAGLSAKEQTIYKSIVTAVENTDNFVDITKHALKPDQATALLDKVFADNPQFFWVSKFVSLMYTSDNKVLYIILYYMDGTAIDTLDAKQQVVPAANRQTIANQIAAFNARVAAVLADVSPALSDIEKEKAIHDYITETVAYDHDSADQTLVYGKPYSRAYDVYGAACEKKAACEGYAKLFQYLCYCVGINATQIVGIGHGGPHMWNAVKIGSDWYNMDVTWDDVEMPGVGYYLYFNRTDSVFAETHTVDSGAIRVPVCVGTAFAPEKTFCMALDGRQKAPANYQTALEYLSNNRDGYLLVYAGAETDLAMYLQMYVYGPQAPVNQHLQNKGYRFGFGNDRFLCGGYAYLQITRK